MWVHYQISMNNLASKAAVKINFLLITNNDGDERKVMIAYIFCSTFTLKTCLNQKMHSYVPCFRLLFSQYSKELPL